MEVILQWLGTLPGAAGQGLVWGLMAIGLYITYKILDLADLTVDGSICTGAAVCAVLLTSGVNIWLAMLCSLLAGMLAGLVTGWLHTVFGIPAILAGILTQLMLWSVNLLVMKGSAIVPITRLKYADKVLITSGDVDIYRTIVVLAVLFQPELRRFLERMGSGLGLMLAMLLFAGVRSRLNQRDIPQALRGLPADLMIGAILAMAVMAF